MNEVSCKLISVIKTSIQSSEIRKQIVQIHEDKRKAWMNAGKLAWFQTNWFRQEEMKLTLIEVSLIHSIIACAKSRNLTNNEWIQPANSNLQSNSSCCLIFGIWCSLIAGLMNEVCCWISINLSANSNQFTKLEDKPAKIK